MMAQAGDRFAGLAKRYDASRPDYPQGLVDWLAAAVMRSTPGLVIDAGSGTGVFTRRLREVLPLDFNLIGIEPSDDMRGKAPVLSGCRFVAGRAEAMPVADASAAAVTAATAAHWFDRSLFYRDCGRVLRPGGVLAIVDYRRDIEHSRVAAALVRFLEEQGGPRAYAEPDYAVELVALDGFEGGEAYDEARILMLEPEQFVGLALSSSHAKPVVERHGLAVAEDMLRALAEPHLMGGLVPFGYRFRGFLVRSIA